MTFKGKKIVNRITSNSVNKVFKAGIFFFFLLSFFIIACITVAASETREPLCGPGSAEYFHDKTIRYSYGTGALQYYLFEPDGPKPATAPLIVFLHGLNGTNPRSYSNWIEHIVKKGNIVVYPQYQSRFGEFEDYTSNAIQSVLEAIEELQNGDHVWPDLDRFAIVGHSCGGMIAPNIAALAEESGLPVPRALMPVEPGKTTPLADLSKIPSDVLLLTVVGDRDFIVGDEVAKKIFRETPQIPLENKDFITLVSDRHGLSSLTAGHFSPCCMSFGNLSIPFLDTDAHDYYGFWKLFDALTDAAFYGKNREYALGNTPQQRYMGEWSDGTPRKELIVSDNP